MSNADVTCACVFRHAGYACSSSTSSTTTCSETSSCVAFWSAPCCSPQKIPSNPTRNATRSDACPPTVFPLLISNQFPNNLHQNVAVLMLCFHLPGWVNFQGLPFALSTCRFHLFPPSACSNAFFSTYSFPPFSTLRVTCGCYQVFLPKYHSNFACFLSQFFLSTRIGGERLQNIPPISAFSYSGSPYSPFHFHSCI